MNRSFKLSKTPHILLLISHRYPPGDSERIAKALETEIAANWSGISKDFFLGLAFGKYDLVLEFEPAKKEDSEEFLRYLREWIWSTYVDHIQLKGCLSNMACYEIQEDNVSLEEDSRVRTYSLFRTNPDEASYIQKVMKYVRENRKKDVETRVFWNPSAMSYMLKAVGDDFGKVFESLYELRERRFLTDFCTFVALDSKNSDKNSTTVGLKAMINIKLAEKGLAKYLLDKETRIRLGFFDLVREVSCPNLDSAFDAIRKTRVQIFSKTKRNYPNKTATILTLDSAFFKKKARR